MCSVKETVYTLKGDTIIHILPSMADIASGGHRPHCTFLIVKQQSKIQYSIMCLLPLIQIIFTLIFGSWPTHLKILCLPNQFLSESIYLKYLLTSKCKTRLCDSFQKPLCFLEFFCYLW